MYFRDKPQEGKVTCLRLCIWFGLGLEPCLSLEPLPLNVCEALPTNILKNSSAVENREDKQMFIGLNSVVECSGSARKQSMKGLTLPGGFESSTENSTLDLNWKGQNTLDKLLFAGRKYFRIFLKSV